MASRVLNTAYPGGHMFSYLRTLIPVIGILCSFASLPAAAQLNGEATAVDPEPIIETDDAPEPEHKDISTAEAEDVTPDHYLDEKVTEERAEKGEKDLLDQSRPVE